MTAVQMIDDPKEVKAYKALVSQFVAIDLQAKAILSLTELIDLDGSEEMLAGKHQLPFISEPQFAALCNIVEAMNETQKAMRLSLEEFGIRPTH